MLWNVTHTTRYFYEAPVSQCLNEVRLTPRSLPNQEVLETNIIVDPPAAFLHRGKDYFGNEVTTFEILEKHDEFTATATSVVKVVPDSMKPFPSLSWEDARDRLATQEDDECFKAFEYIFSSPFVATGPELAEYAQPTFTPGRPLVDALKELSERIHNEFRYKPQSTAIDVPLTDLLRIRHGVCQDFAHVMIGALRSFRLAGRYVSGYIRSGGKGAEASHAWVAAFIPGYGWLSFDPTNNVMPKDSHITLAWGRDYGDVTPMKGIALGGGAQIIEVEVRVNPAA